MHDCAVVGITAEMIGNDLAKCLGEQALVQFTDRLVNVFFGSGYAAKVVTVCHVVELIVRCKCANFLLAIPFTDTLSLAAGW